MHVNKALRELSFDVGLEGFTLEVGLGDLFQGALGPAQKEVDCCVVYEGWEVPESPSEVLSNWRETQNQSQLFLASFQEKLKFLRVVKSLHF